MNLPLTRQRWKPFRIPELFSIRKGNETNMSAMSAGRTPLVSARKVNNGYKGFVVSTNHNPYPGHCITLNNDGDGGAGLAYYQPHSMYLDSHVTALYPLVAMSKYILIFVAKCISLQEKFFGHGHSINGNRLRTFTFMLPVTSTGSPDFDFMDTVMREKEKKILARYAACTRHAAMLALPQCRKWKMFPVSEIFPIIQRGKRLKNADHVPGQTPYASSSAVRNGIDDFVGNSRKVRSFSSCLTLANSGSVGTVFFHPYSFVASDHVTVLIRPNLSRHAYMFLGVALGKLAKNYSFNREINDERLRREKIMLPVKPAGCPDFDFMETFMRCKEAEILGRYAKMRLEEAKGPEDGVWPEEGDETQIAADETGAE